MVIGRFVTAMLAGTLVLQPQASALDFCQGASLSWQLGSSLSGRLYVRDRFLLVPAGASTSTESDCSESFLLAAGVPPRGALVKAVPDNRAQNRRSGRRLPSTSPANQSGAQSPSAQPNSNVGQRQSDSASRTKPSASESLPPAPSLPAGIRPLPAVTPADPLAEFWRHMSPTYLSSSNLNTTDASEVEAMMKAAIDFAGKSYGVESPEVADSTLNLARLYSMQARLGEMAPLLTRLSQLFGKLTPDQQNQMAVRYLDLACQLSDNSRYRQAETAANPVILVSGSARWTDVDQIADKLARIGARLTSNKRYSEAEPFFKAAVSLNEKRVAPDERLLADERVQLASVLQELGKCGAADELYRMALTSHERLYGANDGRLLSDLIGLAKLGARQGKFSDAATLIPRIISVSANCAQDTRSNTVHSLLELSSSCRANAHLDESAALLLKAASLVTLQPHNFSSWEFQQALQDLSENYASAGKIEEGEKVNLAFIKLFEGNQAVSPEWSVTSLLSLLKFYMAHGLLERTEPVEQKLIAACQVDPRNYFHRLREVASLYEQAGYCPGVERLYKVLLSRAAVTGEEKQSQAQDYVRLSNMYVNGRKYAEAEAAWQACGTLMKGDLPPDTADLGTAFDDLLKKLIAQQRFAETQSLMSNLVYSTYWRNRPDALGEAFSQLANMYRQIGDMDKSEQLYKRGVAITEKAAGAQSNYTANILYQYSSLLRQMGRLKEAEDMDARLRKIREQLNHQSSAGSGPFF